MVSKMSRSTAKSGFRIAILVVVGTSVGLAAYYVFVERWDDYQSAAKIAEQESHRLSPENPPSAESFFPQRAAPEQPVVTGYQIALTGEVADALNDDDLVLGVVIDGEARAYPINMMTGPEREVFNDTLAETPLAATW
ncbi:MAG: hypothetical protein CMJ64_02250 [Planctomycetaceae bacterium]|nr:hypothetical protein [Planctomycetaceae bacterium]